MKLHLLAATALCATIAAPAWAQNAIPAKDEVRRQPSAQQDAEPTQLRIRENGATAQRRGESVQDVPIAISAFTSEQLRAQGVNSTLDLGQFVTNVVAINNAELTSINANYIRGLGNTERIATFDPPVGTYVDDIYLSRQTADNRDLLAVERVEVLRGPQGALFGRNTTGGAGNVILREPVNTTDRNAPRMWTIRARHNF